MSNLRNISDTIAAARQRAARSGDTIRSLLSPSPTGSGSSGTFSRPPGITFASLGRQMAGLSTGGTAEGEGGSGEFSLRVTGGGGSKDLSIFLLDPESLSQMCLGAVNGGVKFCMLACDKCAVAAHSKKVKVEVQHVYINAGRNAAYTNPHIAVALLGSTFNVLLGELRPREDWLRIFQVYLDEAEEGSNVKDLVTPKKRKYRYLTDPSDLKTDSNDTLLSSFSSWDMDAPEAAKTLANTVQKLETRVSDFQLAVGEDVDSLLAKLQDLRAVIGVRPSGSPLGGISEECSTIWETFTLLRNCILDPTKFQELEDTALGAVASASITSSKVTDLETAHGDLVELVQLLSTEQENLSQIVTHQGSRASNPSGLLQDLHVLHQRVSTLEMGGTGGPELNTLKAHLKLIEARLPTDPFTIGGRTFNSKADVALFVEKEMSGISFSLFHDSITLLESITDGHTRKADVMAAMYQASRVGFDEDEATHIHSFKLIVPSLLGATKEGDKNDPKFPLPAVKDFSAWNPQDNERGVKKRIQDGMDDISLAVTESITVGCDSSPGAAKLATEMLYQLQLFINELCSWVDSFYLELIKTSQVPAGEAWLLVASCIRKFCEVLRKFRAPADRAASKMDNSTRTTTYLWAMLQVHREMKVIRSHNFRGHPAVAPVITLHVFKTRVTNTAFDKLADALKSIDKKLADTQKNFDKLHDRLSKLEKKS